MAKLSADEYLLREARGRCKREGWKVKEIGDNLYSVSQLSTSLQMNFAQLLAFVGIASADK